MKKGKIILIFLIILLAAGLCIGIGIYLNNISKPKYIFSKGLDIIQNKVSNYNRISNDIDLKDKFSVKGTIEFDLDSEYYKKASTEEDRKILNTINNLNNAETNFKIQKNQSKSTGYIEINSNAKDKEIINAKYYINDSTKYYFVKGIVDNYIIDGGCNYFENLNSTTTERDNFDYLYNFVFDSLKDNLKEEYFNSKEEKNDYVVILKLDDVTLKNILNGVLKDLKNDKRARSILDNTDKSILKTKISEDNYIGKDEYYKIYIYTTKILHKPLKYKVEKATKDSIETYIYEGNETKGNLHYSVNESPKYNISFDIKNNEIKAKIKNAANKEIGEFKLEKNNYNTVINYTIDENDEKIDLIYSSKYKNVKKNESYTNEKNLSFKYVVNKETKLSGEVEINLEASNKVSILTDIADAKLKTNMTEKEKNDIDNLYDVVKNRLER